MAIDANVQSTTTGRGIRLSPRPRRARSRWRRSCTGSSASRPVSGGTPGRRLMRDSAAVAGLVVVALLIVVAVFAPAVTPYPPNDQSFRIKLQAPSAEHLLGTDEFGRDVFSRVLFGTRVALGVGISRSRSRSSSASLSGSSPGYFGGGIDQVVMRVIDVLLAFPWLLLAIGIMAILGPGIQNVIIAVAIVYIPAFARIVRGSVLSIKEKEYVEAARAMGQPNSRIIVRHVLANAWAPIIVLSTLSIGQAIIYAAGLSFIGLGTQPPDADWG